MGKSSAKWIKFVLFGKKKSSSRFGSTEAKDLSVRSSSSSVVLECCYDFDFLSVPQVQLRSRDLF
jgi:hypothetical protein